MKQVDLLKQIQKGNTKKANNEICVGKLTGIRYFGYISSDVNSNSLNNYIQRLTLVNPTDKFVSFQIMGVSSQSKGRDVNSSFAYGSILLLVPRELPIYDWYAVEGTARTALFDGTGEECYIAEMKNNNGVWGIAPSKIYDLCTEFCSPIMEKYIYKSVEEGCFIQPSKPSSMGEVIAYKNMVSSVPLKYEELIDTSNVPLPAVGVNLTVEKEITKKIDNNSKVSVPTANQKTSCKVGIDWNCLTKKYTPKFKPVTRFSMREKTEDLLEVEELCKKHYSILNDTISKLRVRYGINDNTEDICVERVKHIIELIKRSANRKPNGEGYSGYTFMKNFIENHKLARYNYEQGTFADVLLLHNTDTLCDFMLSRVTDLDNGEVVRLNVDTEKPQVCKGLDDIFPTQVEVLYAGLYGVLFNLNVDDMQNYAKICIQKELSILDILDNNPYLLITLTDIKFLNVELLANGRGLIEKNKEWRMTAILKDSLSNDNGSNAFYLGTLQTNGLCLKIGKRKLQNIKGFNSLLNDNIKSNLIYYIDNTLTDEDFYYSSNGFTEYGQLKYPTQSLHTAVNLFLQAGLGVLYKDILYTIEDLRKEIFIINRLYDLYEFNEIDKSSLSKVQTDFETRKALELGISTYKLEQEQADALQLVEHSIGAITGPAGSGKTTSVELLLDALKIIINKPEITINFAAPTGKAAKRLQETVKTRVHTEHSLFKLHIGDLGVFDTISTEVIGFDANIWIFDEQAMASTDLMYNALKRIRKGRVYFLGDKGQIVPIGKGKPFADFLKFIPLVALRVSKRSAEKSTIAQNNRNIDEYSDKADFRELVEGEDTRIINIQNDAIVRSVYDVCAYHLGKKTKEEISVARLVNSVEVLHPDDIQVISPLNVGAWGIVALNTVLQDLFNPDTYKANSSVSFGKLQDMVTLRVGSRVIQTEINYGLRHYSSIENGVFQETNRGGLVNGDTGKIVAIFEGKRCSSRKPMGGREDVFEEREIDNIDSAIQYNNIIVAVKYWDVEMEADIYVLYTGYKSTMLSTMSNIVLESCNLDSLSLAYALTTHKMQGSESKLVIGVIGSGQSPVFINRNMLYTIVSRARVGLYLIGDYFFMEKAREYDGSRLRHTIVDDLY